MTMVCCSCFIAGNNPWHSNVLLEQQHRQRLHQQPHMLYASISMANHKPQCPVKLLSKIHGTTLLPTLLPTRLVCATATTSNHIVLRFPADFSWASSKHTHTHTHMLLSQPASLNWANATTYNYMFHWNPANMT